MFRHILQTLYKNKYGINISICFNLLRFMINISWRLKPCLFAEKKKKGPFGENCHKTDLYRRSCLATIQMVISKVWHPKFSAITPFKDVKRNMTYKTILYLAVHAFEHAWNINKYHPHHWLHFLTVVQETLQLHLKSLQQRPGPLGYPWRLTAGTKRYV